MALNLRMAYYKTPPIHSLKIIASLGLILRLGLDSNCLILYQTYHEISKIPGFEDSGCSLFRYI